MSDPTAEIRSTAGDTSTIDGVRKRYAHLCSLRDAANQKATVVRMMLDAANQRADTARREAQQHAAEIQNIRGGGENWLKLKKEIGQLARLLGGR